MADGPLGKDSSSSRGLPAPTTVRIARPAPATSLLHGRTFSVLPPSSDSSRVTPTKRVHTSVGSVPAEPTPR